MTYEYTKHEVVKKVDMMAKTLTKNEICVEWLHENCYLEDGNSFGRKVEKIWWRGDSGRGGGEG